MYLAIYDRMDDRDMEDELSPSPSFPEFVCRMTLPLFVATLYSFEASPSWVICLSVCLSVCLS